VSTIVWDLEIQKRIVPTDPTSRSAEETTALAEGRAVEGWPAAPLAGISCAVAYEIERRRYRVFGDTLAEHQALAGLLVRAARVVGYNHVNFDYAVLAVATGIPRAELTDVDADPGDRDWDLLQMLWGGIGRRQLGRGSGNSLNDVSRATLGAAVGGKTGDGAQAPELYQAGRWGELVDYCLRDVDLTARLYERAAEGAAFITGEGRVVAPRHPAQWFR